MKRLAILLAALCVSCASAPTTGRYSPQAAECEAQHDIASDHPKIYLAGEATVFEAGVTPGDRHLIEHLPRDHRLPNGRTEPYAAEAAEYARTYNQAIVRHFRIRPNA